MADFAYRCNFWSRFQIWPSFWGQRPHTRAQRCPPFRVFLMKIRLNWPPNQTIVISFGFVLCYNKDSWMFLPLCVLFINFWYFQIFPECDQQHYILQSLKIIQLFGLFGFIFQMTKNLTTHVIVLFFCRFPISWHEKLSLGSSVRPHFIVITKTPTNSKKQKKSTKKQRPVENRNVTIFCERNTFWSPQSLPNYWQSCRRNK